MEEMVRVKYLDSDRLPRMKKLWWYGYSEALTGEMEAFVDLQFAQRASERLRAALKSVGMLKRPRL